MNINLDIRLRLITENDAEYVLSLRKDKRYNQYLSAVNSTVEEQMEWIRRYKSDEAEGKQYYFIIERLDDVRCGTVRIMTLKAILFVGGAGYWTIIRRGTLL